MNHSSVESFLVALFLLSGFAVVRARGEKDKFLNVLVIFALMATGSVIGLVFGCSARNSVVGG